jgi:hypothetical protein
MCQCGYENAYAPRHLLLNELISLEDVCHAYLPQMRACACAVRILRLAAQTRCFVGCLYMLATRTISLWCNQWPNSCPTAASWLHFGSFTFYTLLVRFMWHICRLYICVLLIADVCLLSRKSLSLSAWLSRLHQQFVHLLCFLLKPTERRSWYTPKRKLREEKLHWIEPSQIFLCVWPRHLPVTVLLE